MRFRRKKNAKYSPLLANVALIVTHPIHCDPNTFAAKLEETSNLSVGKDGMPGEGEGKGNNDVMNDVIVSKVIVIKIN